MRTHLPCVAVMVRAAAQTFREILNGILNYNQCVEPWSMLILQARDSNDPCATPSADKLAGIIVDETMDDFGNLDNLPQMPAIAIVSTPPASLDFPFRLTLMCDNERIGQFAADFLLGQGHENFAYVPDRLSARWSMDRGRAFASAVSSAGKTCFTYTPPPSDTQELATMDFHSLCEWLKMLPKPCALFAANDLRAKNVLDAALQSDIAVPRKLSILGCDDEEMICRTTKPTLTSIRFNTEDSGFSAARVLDQMIRTGRPLAKSKRLMTYGPSTIVSRKSTARPTIQDPLVEKAISYIQVNAVDGFNVEDLAGKLCVSRRTLERKFRVATGRSPYDEALRYRLDLACRMLHDSNLKTIDIAEQCGFPDQSHFETMFKRKLGLTVGQYRNRAKL